MQEPPSRQANIETILTTLVEQGAYDCAVVASSDGLPLAMVGEADNEMIAAVAATMKDLAERAHQGLTQIVSRDRQGNEIVSRYFSAGEDLLLLSIKTPGGHSYRRLTGRAINQIRQVLEAQKITAQP